MVWEALGIGQDARGGGTQGAQQEGDEEREKRGPKGGMRTNGVGGEEALAVSQFRGRILRRTWPMKVWPS